VLRAAGEAETTKGNIQVWLELDEGDPGFQVLVFFIIFKLELCSNIFIYFHKLRVYYYIL
jgi:hypothetical protein